MNLISIGKDSRSIIYKHLDENDLYILRYVNTIFSKEIGPRNYFINFDILDYKILCWIEKINPNNDYIKHKVVKYLQNTTLVCLLQQTPPINVNCLILHIITILIIKKYIRY